jgi:hypothetical protein
LRRAWGRTRARRGIPFPSYFSSRATGLDAVHEALDQLHEGLAERRFADEVQCRLSNPLMVGARLTELNLANAHGLDLVSPFLDRRVVELVLGWPVERQLPLEYKGALREAAVGRIPDEVRTRSKDVSLPMTLLRKIVASPAVRALMSDTSVRDRLGDWVRFGRVEGLLDAIGRGYDPPSETFWIQLEGLVTFAYWYRRVNREHGVA